MTTETYKAKAYYPESAGFFEKIEEVEESFDAVCEEYKRRGFKVVECTDDWEDIGE